MNLKKKYEKLVQIIKEMDNVVVAFSGGVDSTFLLKVAYETLKERVVAVSITSPFHPQWELQEAKQLAAEIGVRHEVIKKELDNEEIQENPINRCYVCKKDVFGGILHYASQHGFTYVVDGSNYDDTFDYRPGMQALKEMGIRSPLLEAQLTKDEIRQMSKELGLSTWNKPPYACLLTRIPYGQKIDVETLRKIEKAEKFLLDVGFRQVRVRAHGDIGRIEVAKEEMHKMFNAPMMEKINEAFKEYGFVYVTLDLGGYKTGSLNQGMKE